MFETLADDLVWLLIAAFLLGSVIRRTGMAQRCGLALLSRCGSVASLFRSATLFIAATAFVIPSTSGRAAVLLPVYLALSEAIAEPRIARGLGLLFPTVILLSACASLTGAGAHLIAVDLLGRIGGPKPDFAAWALFAAPFGLLTCLLACETVMALFLRPDDRRRAPGAAVRPDIAWTQGDLRIGAIVGVTVISWATGGWHGFGLAVVALAGAVAAASRTVSGVAFAQAVKDVDWNLLLFLSATLAIGSALLDVGAAAYLADTLLAAMPASLLDAPLAVVFCAGAVAALSHLVIVSRTARAAVLVPTIALPLASSGVDPLTLVLTVTIGSGFCQTFAVSAKPVMIYAGSEARPFGDGDLLRLALWLLPPFLALLTLFAGFVWPFLARHV